MINLLSANEIEESAISVAVRRDGPAVAKVNELGLDLVGRRAAIALTSARTSPQYDLVATIAAAMAASIELNPPVATDSSDRLSLRLARRLAIKNGFVLEASLKSASLRLAFSLSRPDDDPCLDALHQSILGAIIDRETGLPPADMWASPYLPFPEPIRAFVALPMSSIQERELNRLKELGGAISDALSSLGILTYQPVQWTDPFIYPELAYSPATHDLDTDHLVRTDLFVGLHERPSTGFGVAMTYANRSGAAEILLGVKAGYGSPLVVGSTGDVEFASLSDPVSAVHTVENFALRQWPLLEMRRRRRVARSSRYGRLLAAFRDSMGAADRDGRLDTQLPALLTAARCRELLRSVNHLATGTQEELDALGIVLGVPWMGYVGEGTSDAVPDSRPVGVVRMHEVDALRRASRIFKWTPQRTDDLLARAQELRAVTRRLELGQPGDWKRLDDRRSGS